MTGQRDRAATIRCHPSPQRTTVPAIKGLPIRVSRWVPGGTDKRFPSQSAAREEPSVLAVLRRAFWQGHCCRHRRLHTKLFCQGHIRPGTRRTQPLLKLRSVLLALSPQSSSPFDLPDYAPETTRVVAANLYCQPGPVQSGRRGTERGYDRCTERTAGFLSVRKLFRTIGFPNPVSSHHPFLISVARQAAGLVPKPCGPVRTQPRLKAENTACSIRTSQGGANKRCSARRPIAPASFRQSCVMVAALIPRKPQKSVFLRFLPTFENAPYVNVRRHSITKARLPNARPTLPESGEGYFPPSIVKPPGPEAKVESAS